MSDTDREYIVGRNPVYEALAAGREMERIYISEGASGSVAKIKAMAKDAGVRVDIVDKARIDRMAPGEKHQGIIAEVASYEYAEWEDIFARAEKSGEPPFVIVLDEISDPHNLGAIIRTAECAGAHGVIIPKRRAATLNSTVAKASAGAIERMPVVKVTNLARAIEDLKERGLWIAACDMDGEVYHKAPLDGAIGIVIGSEGKGLGRLVKEKCDFTVSIPIMGDIQSLNASNAAAVVMYEVRRRRQ